MTDNAGIQWEEPPPSRSGRDGQGRVQHLMAVLRQNPGEWARLDGYASQASAYMAAKRIKNEPGFEAVSRGAALYARYIGKGAE